MQSTSKKLMRGNLKFILGGGLILAAVVYLIFSSTQASAEYFMTVDELKAKGSGVAGQNLRVSGAVDGSTIQFDSNSMKLSFQVAQVPGDNATVEAEGGLAAVLHAAVIDPKRARLSVIYNGPKPDLLQNEAQAIMTGHLGQDGVFYADELLLKCPTKYQQAVPSQAANGN
jgi:cytochrome c-type biogenesis protein CcmE